MLTVYGEDAGELHAGDQGAEAHPQHLRRLVKIASCAHPRYKYGHLFILFLSWLIALVLVGFRLVPSGYIPMLAVSFGDP